MGVDCNVKTLQYLESPVWLGLRVEGLLTRHVSTLYACTYCSFLSSLSLSLYPSPLFPTGLSLSVNIVFIPCLLAIRQLLGLVLGPGRSLA